MTAKTVQEQMEGNQRRYRNRVEEIREDPDLNEDARRRYLKDAHQEARTKHAELFEEQRQTVAEKLEKKRKAALAPPELFGADKASLAMSYRDALDRATNTQDAAALKDLLDRAHLTGDRVLAKAALFVGYQKYESEAVVGDYLEAYPDDRQRWDEFMEAAQEHNALENQEKTFGQLGPEPPRELGGVG